MRFCVIGTGYIGPINTRALLSTGDAEVVGVANRTTEKAQKMCDKLGLTCPIYSDWREMLRREKPEAVVINLYNDLHKECFLECAAMGLDILVEKPVSNTYEECLEMMEAARKNGIKVSVLQTQRYSDILQATKKYVTAHADELGPLLAVNDIQSIHYFWDGRSPWHLDPVRSGGGIVMNYGVHQLDRVHWFLDQKTVRFCAQYLTAKPGVDTYSSYSMMGVGEKGTHYNILCTGYSGPWINQIVLIYQNGIVRAILTSNGIEEEGVYAGSNETGVYQKVPYEKDGPDYQPAMYGREFREAVDYLIGKTDTAPVPLEWGTEMVRLCNLGFEQTV